jgi:uncharacterized repeat protein (TIGR01451 family)
VNAAATAPDLEVTALVALSSRICAGSSPTFRASIRNNGSVPSGDFGIRWVAGEQNFDGGHLSIPGGGTDTHDHIWNPPIAQGQHSLTFIADLNNGIPEPNEDNNHRTITFTAENCPVLSKIQGRVTDAQGTPIAGVAVALSGGAGGGRSTKTRTDGSYVWADLEPGTFTLKVSKAGYKFSPASRTITVPPNATGNFTGTRTDADLSVTMADSPDAVKQGLALTYSVTITNKGPATATSVVLSVILPRGVLLLVAPAPSQGTCTVGIVTCNLGKLARNARATVKITMVVTGSGTLTSTAQVSAKNLDRNTANNKVKATTKAQPAPPGGSSDPAGDVALLFSFLGCAIKVFPPGEAVKLMLQVGSLVINIARQDLVGIALTPVPGCVKFVIACMRHTKCSNVVRQYLAAACRGIGIPTGVPDLTACALQWALNRYFPLASGAGGELAALNRGMIRGHPRAERLRAGPRPVLARTWVYPWPGDRARRPR